MGGLVETEWRKREILFILFEADLILICVLFSTQSRCRRCRRHRCLHRLPIMFVVVGEGGWGGFRPRCAGYCVVAVRGMFMQVTWAKYADAFSPRCGTAHALASAPTGCVWNCVSVERAARSGPTRVSHRLPCADRRQHSAKTSERRE